VTLTKVSYYSKSRRWFV